MILSDENLFPTLAIRFTHTLVLANTAYLSITSVVITFEILTYTSSIAHRAQCTSSLQMKPNLAVF